MLRLQAQDVHVWIVRMAAMAGLIEQLAAILSPDELQRAKRFRSEHSRRSFVITRGVLRNLLGRYLDTPPAQIEFIYSPRGKPSVASTKNLGFSVTHSGDVALLAVATGCAIGVDIEEIRSISDLEDIAGRFFCTEETLELQSFPSAQRERAFFTCWARKEAYLKATGQGLHDDLDSFRVNVHPDEPARLIQIAGDPQGSLGWTLTDLEIAPEYAAALAYRGRAREVTLLQDLTAADLMLR